MFRYHYKMRSWYWGDSECKGVDYATFTLHNSQWATDKNGLFNGHRRVRVKDPSTIRVLNHLLAKDSEHVYYIMGTAKAVVDPASFEVLPEPEVPGAEPSEASCGYARDKINVYFTYRMSGAPKILRKADRNRFQVIGPGRAKDYQHVWAEDKIIKGADPNTFELINNLYSKDARCVYYDEAPLRGSDPQTSAWLVPRSVSTRQMSTCFASVSTGPIRSPIGAKMPKLARTQQHHEIRRRNDTSARNSKRPLS